MFTPSNTSRGRSQTTVVPLNGHFDNGIWHCNCRPRKPANRFEVKKEGPNRGKWFYTCQESRDQGCKFFLWEDKAKGREKKAVLSNSRTEPALESYASPVTPRNGPSAGKTFEEFMRGSGGAKMVAAKVKEEDDDEFGWPLSPGEERRMEDVVSRASVEVSTPRSSLLETPRKSVKTNMFDTPGSKRKRDVDVDVYPTPNTGNIFSSMGPGEMPYTTPSTGNLSSTLGPGEDPFQSSSIPRQSSRYPSSNKTRILASPSQTPTPVRFRNTNDQSLIPSSQASTSTITQEYDLTDEVMDLLRDQDVDTEVMGKLKGVLDKYVLKKRGIARGRDITREALRGKEVKILELEERVRALETEREMDRLVMRKLRGGGRLGDGG